MLSLENICLNLIVEKFEKFHLAIAASNNQNLKRNLEFLLRRYSSELASELFKRKKLKDEYLGFLINEHLKFFDKMWLWNSRYQNSMKDILCRLPNLTKIACFETNDEMLENIAKFCPKIVEIDGVKSSVTDHGVTYLCKQENGSVCCPELKKLYINTDTVTVKAVENVIRDLKSLEEIRHEKVPLALYFIHKDDLPRFENMPRYNLVELSLYTAVSLPYYDDILKICLTVCPKLRSLECSILNKEQLSFFNHTALEIAFLFSKEIGPKINIDSFIRNCGRNLISFQVINYIMSVSELAASCPKLKFLIIDNIMFSDDHGDSKTVFHSLDTCTFQRDTILSEDAMSFLLLSSPNLHTINFNYCFVSPDLKTYILKCCEKQILTKISFMQCTNVEKNFFKNVLLSCPSLSTLEISYCDINEKEELFQLAKTLPNKPSVFVYEFLH